MRQLIDVSFKPVREFERKSVRGNESMIDHLARETALEIENKWTAEQSTQHAADQRAFVQMRVYDIGAKLNCGLQ